MLQAQSVQPLDERGVRENQARATCIDSVFERCALVRRVQRHEDGAEIVDCKPGANERRAVRQPRDYTIAGTHTERLQRRRLRANLLATLAPGPLRAVFEQRESV